MGPFAIAILSLVLGLAALGPDLRLSLEGAGVARGELARASSLFRELEDLLAAGVLPGPERWDALKALVQPWGSLAYESLSELRSRGGALLPTLRRLRALADQQLADLLEGKARSASALAQALCCGALVPLLSATLYLLLPGLSEHRALWLVFSGVALGWSGFGALWLLSMAERARWGGLSRDERPQLLLAYCAGERILALLRSGQPADLAWAQSIEALRKEGQGLSWSPSVWAPPEPADSGRGAAGLALARAGETIRKAVQCTLMEGRPSADRIESATLMLRQEIRASVERELSLLSTRALKPLFLCVAPALLGLLASAIALIWLDSAAGF